MSDTNESSAVRLEDGEIDEHNQSSILPESMTESDIVKDLRVSVENFVKADKSQNDDQLTFAVCESDKDTDKKRRESSETYNSEKDQEIVYIDEDEMLCVRGASPVPLIVERLIYSRKSPLQNCDTISLDITPPKRRKTSNKRRRKRTTPRKLVKNKDMLKPENTELGNPNFKDKEGSESPQETSNNLPQLCKFYLQDCCAKKSKCEYMHSEFPCKFYYMGLKCQDETSEKGCKLYHGGPLSVEMLSTLERHIKTAPIDVLGEVFVDFCSNIEDSKISQILEEMQEKLTSSKNESEKVSLNQNDTSNFFLTLKEKLCFLSEEQIEGLEQLNITNPNDLLNLTLAQLNAIGIHATQIEALQMSFVAGQDTDMRNINPSQFRIPINQNVPSFELPCYNEENTCSQNWYEKEETPLVIDEPNVQKNYENETTNPELDDIIIDVVGDSRSDSYSSTIEDEVIKVEDNATIASSSDTTDRLHHFVVEETQEGIEVFPNSVIMVNNYFPSVEYPETVTENNQEGIRKSGELQEQNDFNVIYKPEEEFFPKYDELQKQIQCLRNHELDENPNKLEEFHISEALSKGIIRSSENKDQTQPIENTKETSEDLSKELQGPTNKARSQLKENTTVNVFSALEDVIEKKIETRSDEENRSPEKELTSFCSISQQKSRSFKQNEDKNISQHRSFKSPNENNGMDSPQPKSDIAEIDLTVTTPPRKLTEEPLPIRFKIEPKREYNNPFQRKIMCPVDEAKKRYSPVEEQRKCYIPELNYKSGHQMEGDNSSEDWDADERSDIQSPPKEIASPDLSDNESTPFVADGSCPELPRRTKNLDNYQPALEINAHLTYPPMEYKLYEIYMPQYEVNKPTLMEKLIKANSTDPRLKKYIEKEKNHGIFPQAEYSFFPPNISQCDPRLRPGTGTSCQDQNYNASRVLYSYLQRSQWYQELKSNLKIQINHSVSDLVHALNYFHKDPSPQKIFDLFQIECAGVLLEVMRNVGIFIDVNGNITEEANYNQLCAPLQQQPPSQQCPSPFGIGCLGPNAKPGLLGFAPPGVPHPRHNNSSMSTDHSFARQAFGNDCVCNNNNNDFQPTGSTFYVGGRYGMNRNQEPGFGPPPYQRQNQKRNFERR